MTPDIYKLSIASIFLYSFLFLILYGKNYCLKSLNLIINL